MVKYYYKLKHVLSSEDYCIGFVRYDGTGKEVYKTKNIRLLRNERRWEEDDNYTRARKAVFRTVIISEEEYNARLLEIFGQ